MVCKTREGGSCMANVDIKGLYSVVWEALQKWTCKFVNYIRLV